MVEDKKRKIKKHHKMTKIKNIYIKNLTEDLSIAQHIRRSKLGKIYLVRQHNREVQKEIDKVIQKIKNATNIKEVKPLVKQLLDLNIDDSSLFHVLGTIGGKFKIDFYVELEKDNNDPKNPDNWITIKGTHVFIPEGKSKAQALKEFIAKKEKGMSLQEKEERRQRFYQKLKEETPSGKKKKKEPELTEREKGIRKLIEKTGYERKRAEREYDKKHPKKPTKTEIRKKESLEKHIDQISSRIRKRHEKLSNLAKQNKSKAQIFNEIMEVMTQILKEINKPNLSGNIMIPIAKYYDKIRKDKSLTEKEKIKLQNEINELNKDLNKLIKKRNHEEDLTTDFIDIQEFTNITTDFGNIEDFTVLHGPITRAGAFEYTKNGKKIILFKDWKNILDVHNKQKYYPLKATTDYGAHHSIIKGYATNWEPHHDTEQMYADVVLFNDLENETDLLDPEGGYQVSIGFKDNVIGNTQYIEYIDHLALSLKNLDIGRCSTANGKPCTVKRK